MFAHDVTPNPTPRDVIPLRCRLGWHPWGRWSKQLPMMFGKVVYTVTTQQAIEYPGQIQERLCPGCGKYEWRKV